MNEHIVLKTFTIRTLSPVLLIPLFFMLGNPVYSLLAESSAKRTNTQFGQKTISKYTQIIPSSPDKIFSQICDFQEWTKWITTSQKFTDFKSPQLKTKGDSFTERFGLFDSSSISWEVTDIRTNELLALKTTRSVNTIAWDDLEMEFLLTNRDGKETNLALTYSWTISNPLFAALEAIVVGKSMMDDNIAALAKLEKIVVDEKTSKDTK